MSRPISPMDAWSIFVSIKLHFSPDKKYDAFAFNFKGPRCRRETFIKMSTRHLFEKFAKRYNRFDMIGFYVANFLDGKTWVGDMSHTTFEIWRGRLQSLDYIFKNDLDKIREAADGYEFDSAIIPKNDSEIPSIYRLYRLKEISLETLACLESLVGYTRDLDKKLSDPFGICKGLSHMIRAYAPFLRKNFDREKYRQTVIFSFTKQTN
jgi:hypothetical protein